MKEKIYLSLFFLFSVIGWSQEKTITGVVTSESDKMPLPGVSVVVKGTSRGVATDFDGKYQISAKDGEVLVFSFVGFHTEEKKVVGGVNH